MITLIKNLLGIKAPKLNAQQQYEIAMAGFKAADAELNKAMKRMSAELRAEITRNQNAQDEGLGWLANIQN